MPEQTAAPDTLDWPHFRRPNVLMVVLDDLGFADLGGYGSEVATPNTDRLAEHGVRYNNFHVTAVCAPTRACLLTGRNHHAVGIGHNPELAMPFPGYAGRIPPSAGSLPRLLRDVGYNTFAVGKWHQLSLSDYSPAGPFDQWPLGMGFERFYGFFGPATNQWTPDLVSDNGFIDPPRHPDDGYHLTEDMADQAIRFIQDQQQAAPDRPFFCYFATGAMHQPHQVSTEWITPYRGKFDAGWEVVREERFLRQMKLGVVPSGTTLTDRPSWVPPWNSLSSGERRVLARQMETYAGFLTHTDAQIGRLLAFLTEIDVMDNTIVLVLSDNGANGGSPGGSLTAGVSDVYSMLSRLDDFGGFRARNHYASGWAWTGNAPFRLWKAYTWLGGVRVPLVIHWPNGISVESHGQVRTQFGHAIDLMPTVLDAAGVDAPDVLDGVGQQPLGGQSLLATVNDAELPSARHTQYFEMGGSRAIIYDGWKATTDHLADKHPFVVGSSDFDTDRWSLFHLDEDFAEAHDVSSTYPDRLRQMIDLWFYEAGRNQVLPLIDEPWLALDNASYLQPRKHVYRSDSGPIVTPPLAAGFTVIADLDMLESQDSAGIICAQGDWHAGWVCYVLDGRPIVAFVFNGNMTRLAASETLSSGGHQLEIRYLPSTKGPGLVSLTVDTRQVATKAIPDGPPKLFEYTTKLTVGRDRGFPVCADYQPPFPFTGKIRRVLLSTPGAS